MIIGTTGNITLINFCCHSDLQVRWDFASLLIVSPQGPYRSVAQRLPAHHLQRQPLLGSLDSNWSRNLSAGITQSGGTSHHTLLQQRDRSFTSTVQPLPQEMSYGVEYDATNSAAGFSDSKSLKMRLKCLSLLKMEIQPLQDSFRNSGNYF